LKEDGLFDGLFYINIKSKFLICDQNLIKDQIVNPSNQRNMITAEMHTDRGVMKIQFYEKDAPNTVKNFVKLSKEGFYDGLTFHRVLPNFVIQGGDPTGTGAGGPGYTIKCELEGENQYHDKGVLSMAHAGRRTLEEIPGDLNFLYVTTEKEPNTLIEIILASAKFTKAWRL
jgi:hypothetical protein